MRKRIPFAGCRRMIADKNRRVKAGINSIYHGVRMTGPAPNQGNVFRKLPDIQIVPILVGIPHYNFRSPGFTGSLTGSDYFHGHLLRVQSVIFAPFFRFRPQGCRCDAFNVRADKNFHIRSLLPLSIKGPA